MENSITGIVITLNEEANIQECLESLKQVCNELIVVDSGSSDHTIAKAEACGAKVLRQDYLGDGPQKNVALSHCSYSWVLSLDADERITPELAQEINHLNLSQSPHTAYTINRKNFIGTRWIKCCHWWPNPLVRLYKKELHQFCNSKQHAFVEASQPGKLSQPMLHFTYKNIGEMFTKQAKSFSTRSAKILYLSGKKVNALSPVVHGIGSFLNNYLVRGGIWGGIDGLSISLAMSVNAYLKYAKVLEYQRDKSVLDHENFNKVW